MSKLRAIGELEQRLVEDPENLVLRQELAQAYQSGGRREEAVSLFFSTAVAYRSRGDARSAADMCRRILSLQPRHVEAQALKSQLDSARPDYIAKRASSDMLLTPTPLPAPMPIHELTEDSIVGRLPIGNPSTEQHGLGALDGFPSEDGESHEVTAEFTGPGSPHDFEGDFEETAEHVTAVATRHHSGDSERDTQRLPQVGADAKGPLASEEDFTDDMLTPIRIRRLRPDTVPSGADTEHEPCVDPNDYMTHLPVSVSPVRSDGASLRMRRTFNGSFDETLQLLAPDGSAIEPPLTLFADLPEPALSHMARNMRLLHYAAGETVIAEGEPGHACYVIHRGEVRVLKRDPLSSVADSIEVARLGEGALFGEFALFSDRRRHATVQALTASDIYEIPRELLLDLRREFPEVGPILESFYRERLLSTLLFTAPFFQPLAEDRRGQLLSMFEPQRAEDGEKIIEEGREVRGFYLIVLGSVHISTQDADGAAVALASLGEGAYFGEMSLLRGSAACATVTAHGPTELAVLPPREFYDVVAAHPQLWDHVKREAARRRSDMAKIVSGNTPLV